MSQRSVHAKLAPSAASRWINCPGSVRLSEGREDESSEHAKEGTFAHEIAELCLLGDMDAAELIGCTRTVEGSTFTLCEENAEHVQTYLDVVRAYEEDALDSWYELRVFWSLDPRVYGTADAVILRDGALEVIDLKFGKGVEVRAEGNPQLRIYALGALDTLGVEPDVVRCHVVQPRHFAADTRGAHDVEELTIEELRDWALTLRDSAQATSVAAPALASGDWCRWCLAAAECPELRSRSLAIADSAFAELDPETLREPPEPAAMTPGEIARALDVFPDVERWMKAVREHAYKLANSKAAGAIPGYKLVQKLGNLAWTKPEADVAKLLVAAGADPFKRTLITPAQARRILGTAVVDELSRRPERGTVLVPDTDGRPPHSAADAFDVLDV